jgi:hypothetical protein
MTSLVVITPSFEPDLELFRELHDSVLQHAPEGVVHHAIVPARDVRQFSRIRSGRLVVRAVEDVLPQRFVSTYGAVSTLRRLPGVRQLPSVQALNLRHPWPPVRGWILQQVVKLAAASQTEADVAIAVDSDVCFIRPFEACTFHRSATTRFFRRRGAICDDMVEHRKWHRTAQHLLGLPADPTDRTDYIAPLVALDPQLVGALRERLESVHERPWIDLLAGQLTMSEYILYGTFVDRLAVPAARSWASGHSLCLSRWTEAPLQPGSVDPFLDGLAPDDVAVHVQSTLDTDATLRRTVVEGARERSATLRAAAQRPTPRAQ